MTNSLDNINTNNNPYQMALKQLDQTAKIIEEIKGIERIKEITTLNTNHF